MTAKSESRPQFDRINRIGGASFIFAQILPPEAPSLSKFDHLFFAKRPCN